MKKPILKFRTIILSDVHLGAPDCQIEKVNHFLKHTRSERLILNGDIIDGWSLKRRGGWTSRHTRFVRLVLKKMEKQGTEVIYLRGNHDDILASFLPFAFDKLRIEEEYVHTSATGRRYLCIHGDVLDSVTRNFKLLAIAGDIGYQTLMRINRAYNRYRKWRGRDYYSLSKAIKANIKGAVNYVSRWEQSIVKIVGRQDCEGFICGHIHTPANRIVDGVHYLNSGDWVESNTALVEHDDGTFEILDYDTFCARLEMETARREAVQVPVFRV